MPCVEASSDGMKRIVLPERNPLALDGVGNNAGGLALGGFGFAEGAVFDEYLRCRTIPAPSTTGSHCAVVRRLQNVCGLGGWRRLAAGDHHPRG
jgi:hypothetical protein